MVDRQGIFRAIVTPVNMAWGPVKTKLALYHTAMDPVEYHVHGIDIAWDDGVIHNAYRCGVVSMDWRRRLWPAHFDKGLAYGYHFLGIDEEATKFGLGGQGH